jgi:hypothetical protein
MEQEPLVSRDEVTGVFFVIADIGAGVQRIVELLEEAQGGEDHENES